MYIYTVLANLIICTHAHFRFLGPKCSFLLVQIAWISPLPLGKCRCVGVGVDVYVGLDAQVWVCMDRWGVNVFVCNYVCLSPPAGLSLLFYCWSILQITLCFTCVFLLAHAHAQAMHALCVFAYAHSHCAHSRCACSVCLCLRTLTLCTLTLCMLLLCMLNAHANMTVARIHRRQVEAAVRIVSLCPSLSLTLSHSLSLSLSLSHTHTHTHAHTHTLIHTHTRASSSWSYCPWLGMLCMKMRPQPQQTTSAHSCK